jgi:hypothetical protein
VGAAAAAEDKIGAGRKKPGKVSTAASGVDINLQIKTSARKFEWLIQNPCTCLFLESIYGVLFAYSTIKQK